MGGDIATMTCDWCVEAGIDAVYADSEGEEWKGAEEPIGLPPGHFAGETREQMKSEMGLDDTQLDQLLTTGSVDGLGAIICLKCQDSGWGDP